MPEANETTDAPDAPSPAVRKAIDHYEMKAAEYEAADGRRMGFGGAIVALKSGKAVTRTGWNGKGMWIALQKPDPNSWMGRPYIFMRPVDGALVPWVASQTDLLADDWMIVYPTLARGPEPKPETPPTIVQQPSLGRIVLVRWQETGRDPEEERPAIVTKVHAPHVIDVTVFNPNGAPGFGLARHEDAPREVTAERWFTWRWPPRV